MERKGNGIYRYSIKITGITLYICSSTGRHRSCTYYIGNGEKSHYIAEFIYSIEVIYSIEAINKILSLVCVTRH